MNTCQEQSQSNGITNAPSQAPKQVDNSFAPIHSKLYRKKKVRMMSFHNIIIWELQVFNDFIKHLIKKKGTMES